MKILIQKFGGTSVSTAERRSLVVDKIVKAKSRLLSSGGSICYG